MLDSLRRKLRIWQSRIVPRVYNLRDIYMVIWFDREFYIEKWRGNAWRN